LDYLIVTDYERMVLHINDMADSVAKKDSDRIFTHISDKFQLGSATKKDLRRWVDDTIKKGDVTGLTVWDFQRGDISPEKRVGKINFMVKGRGPQVDEGKFFSCVATFALEPDGEWRMTTFDLGNPINKSEKIDI